jgi:hypothetical protein
MQTSIQMIIEEIKRLSNLYENKIPSVLLLDYLFKEQQKQLIIEIMDLDAKDGLYEISDEEIEKAAKKCRFEDLDISVGSFELGAKWYREQLKNIDKKL